VSADAYFAQAIKVLEDVRETQAEVIGRAADVLVEAVMGDRAIYAFGATHSFMVAEELVYRTGGLMLVNPIYPHGMNLFVRPMTSTSRLERVPGLGRELLGTVPLQAGDAVVVASTSGRNAVPIDLAMEAGERGAHTIAITSMAYTSGVGSRHPSGKKLCDVCETVIDNGAPHGDAAAEIPGFPQRVGPLSTVTACAVVNALIAETVARLVARGETPPVFVSANLDGGDEHNAELLARNRHRIHYLG